MSKTSLLPRGVAYSFVLAIALAAAVPASADISMSTTQAGSIQNSLRTGIAGANGNPIAIEATIAQAAQNGLVGSCDRGMGTAVASLIITSAEEAGATGAEIGTGLGQAAAALEASCPAAADGIAAALANEGRTEEILAFQKTVTDLGYETLASTAGEGGTVTGETGGNVGSSFSTGGGFNGGTGGGGGGGCLNPSCSKP